MESAKALKQFVQFRPWANPAVRITCFEMSADEAKPLLHDAAEYCLAHGLTVETAHDERETREGLDQMIAHWAADAVVMGSTARSRLFRHFFGDTALAHGQECPSARVHVAVEFAMLELMINGESMQAPDGWTVADLVKQRRLEQQPCAVEVNRKVVPKPSAR